MAILGEDHIRTQQSLKYILELYKAWDKPEKVAEYEMLMPENGDIS